MVGETLQDLGTELASSDHEHRILIHLGKYRENVSNTHNTLAILRQPLIARRKPYIIEDLTM